MDCENIKPPQATSSRIEEADHPTHLALQALEKSIGTSRVHLFRMRLEDKRDDADPLLVSWKALYEGWQNIKAGIEEAALSSSSIESDSSEVLKLVLVYPVVTRTKKKR